jgi:L-serine dehydratase
LKRQNPSIFNDIVGPTMVGPSSSHTCGPSRIGYLSQQILSSTLKKATIEFAQKGAYTNMYKGQRSDLGFVNGLLGYRPENPLLRDSINIAREKGITVDFVISDFEPIFPNIAKLTLIGADDEVAEVFSDSTGGGTVKLLKINGFDVAIVGDCYELLVRGPIDKKQESELFLKYIFSINEGFYSTVNDKEFMVNVKSREDFPQDILRKVKVFDGVTWVKVLKPILVVPSNRNAQIPFRSGEDLEKLCQETGQELWELGVEYEVARSGWTRSEVVDYMEYVIKTMESGVKEALKGDINMHGIIQPTAGKIAKYIQNPANKLDIGVLATAVPWSMATMEYSSAMGVVLCAPTGGSAGVFPGAVLGVANHMDLPFEKKVEAMFAASAIGIVMSKDHNYSAELYGCQVEPGAASAMAAGALVYLMGGTVKESLAAASCAIQNILGLICDPVAGLVQVPCISRNASSVANAVVSATIVMGGYDPLIPLDQSAETMFRVGTQLPSELRCTCEGGLCITPCGQELAKEQEQRDQAR